MMTALTPRQARTVAAILTTRTIEAAAKLAQVNSRTIRRWAKQEQFQAALAAERRELFSAATNELRVAAGEAVSALRDVLRCPETPSAVLVQAASAVLAHAFKAVELADISERIDALEEAAANAKSHN